MSVSDHPVTEAVRRPAGQSLVEVAQLVKTYSANGRGSRRPVTAVDGVCFQIAEGETLALVGESGSGKSTVGRCLLRLVEPTSGMVSFKGRPITGLSRRAMRPLRAAMQIVFQDPYSAIDPRMTVGDFIAEPLRVHGWTRRALQDRVVELVDVVGLAGEHRGRYPHELSGGQRQRVVIARALALRPRLLVLDEPVAALDVSIQAGIMALLARLQADEGLSFLFIAHDLAVVRQLSHRVAVMYRGRIVETGTAAEIYDAPRHPYTQALLSAAPVPDPAVQRARRRIVLPEDPPDLPDQRDGCVFRSRCWKARDECAHVVPELVAREAAAASVACHFPEQHATPAETEPVL